MPALSRTINNQQSTINKFIHKRVVSCQLLVVSCRRWRQGFTLIELMITIGILSILATFMIYSFTSAQQKARDGRRKSDLAQIKKALELAKADCQGSAYYPVMSGGNETTRYTTLQAYLADTDLKYMSNVPNDPKNVSPYVYGYNTWTSGSVFQTSVCLDINAAKNQSGSSDFMLHATLERGTNDPDGRASWTKCQNKPSIPAFYTAGNYYVCND